MIFYENCGLINIFSLIKKNFLKNSFTQISIKKVSSTVLSLFSSKSHFFLKYFSFI